MSPHDLYDYDGVNENILIDGAIEARQRKLLVHPDRNGYLYVVDRVSGEVIAATPYAAIKTTKGVDLQTGRLRYVAEKAPIPGKVVRDICPAAPGAKDWQPSAYSPRTGLVYIPHQNLCQEEQTTPASYIAGTPYVGATVKMYAGPGGNRGALSAWDPLTAKQRWAVDEDLPVWSGALATGGDLVFYGTMDGWFKAVDAKTGSLVWQYKTGSGIVGQPVSY